MFDKNKFAQILKNINETYNSQRDFAKKSEINRTYLSQYMNMKLNEPPKPKTLEKIAKSSHGITNYRELMNVCGYITDLKPSSLNYYLNHDQINSIYGAQERYSLNDDEIFILNDLLNKSYILKEDSDGNLYIDLKLDDYLLQIKNISQERLIFLVDIAKQIIFNAMYNAVEEKREQENSKSQYYMCPVYGHINAGQPNWREECIEGRFPIDPELMGIVNPEEHFFLRINDESMNRVVKNGAFALIHKQDLVEDGEIAVVLVNGYDATLKKFTKQGDVIILEPDSNDNSLKIQLYDKTTPIKILGKYVGKMEINK